MAVGPDHILGEERNYDYHYDGNDGFPNQSNGCWKLKRQILGDQFDGSNFHLEYDGKDDE